MWLFTKHGFYSVVEDRADPRMLIVRARVRQDLVRLLRDAGEKKRVRGIRSTRDADYEYRVWLPRSLVAQIAAGAVRAIDYANFKDAFADKSRKGKLMQVWTVMAGGLRNFWERAPEPARDPDLLMPPVLTEDEERELRLRDEEMLLPYRRGA